MTSADTMITSTTSYPKLLLCPTYQPLSALAVSAAARTCSLCYRPQLLGGILVAREQKV
jgi:hypothetical protein